MGLSPLRDSMTPVYTQFWMEDSMSDLVRSQDAEVAQANTAAKIMVYSDDRSTRAEVRTAVGRRPGKGAPTVEWFEAATEFGVLDLLEQEVFDLLILDGEAAKVGGMGLAKQLKDEVQNCPPILLLIARPQDEWLGRWSLADSMTTFPINPRDIQQKVTTLLGARAR